MTVVYIIMVIYAAQLSFPDTVLIQTYLKQLILTLWSKTVKNNTGQKRIP